MTEYYGYGPKAQKRLIKARINVPLQDHQEWCIINAIWFQQWKDFVGLREDNEEKRDKGPTPAEINNNGLLLDGLSNLTKSTWLRPPIGSLVLKPDLILGQDYCLIPEDAYGILEHWYVRGGVEKLTISPKDLLLMVYTQGMVVLKLSEHLCGTTLGSIR